MFLPILRRSSRRAAWCAGFVLSLLAGGSARAQLISPDPYDPWGRPYRAFTYPAADDPRIGGQTPRSRAPAANQFDRLGDDFGLNGRSGRYDSAYRRLDREFGREYIPNQKADAAFYADRDRREKKAIGEMRDRNPARYESMSRDANPARDRTDAPVAGGAATRRDRGATSATAPAPSRRPTRGSNAPPAPLPPGRSRATSGTQSRAATPAPRALPSSGSPAPAAPSARSRDGGDVRPSEVLERARELDRARDRDRAPVRSPRRT